MIDEIFLNELSCTTFGSEHQACTALQIFFETFKAARKLGFPNRIRSSIGWFDHEFFPGLRFGTWAKRFADRDLRGIALAMTVNAPAIREDELEELSRASGFEFFFGDTSCVGIGLSWLFGATSLSFDVDPFNTVQIELNVEELSGDPPEIVRSAQRAQNLSRPEHLASALVRRRAKLRGEISSGSDLWRLKDVAFPNLVFCAQVEEQLGQVLAGDPALGQIVKALIELDEFAPRWNGSMTPATALTHITPESGKTMARYGRDRSFVCPDGTSREFSLHGRLTPGARRYYILDHLIESKIVVGYIGKKLPTISDPT